MKISYSQVESYCNELHTLAKNMKETMDNIEMVRSKVTSDGSWVGNASNSYMDKLKFVTNNFNEIFIEIENSILYMAKCSEGYQSIDTDVIREICDNLSIAEPSLETSNIFNGV